MNNTIRESDFLFYRGEDGKVHAQVVLGDQTVWVSQNTMSEIFGIDRTGISKHIRKIFEENELVEDSVSAKIAHTANDGKVYDTTFYNLDVIIAVGYRVNTYKATKFRQWSIRILNEYLIKGFVLDDERLKQGNKLFGKDYFQELLERVQAIRASEKMFYDKIKDLYATSVDYDPGDPSTYKFFAKVQNKVEYAIVQRTSAETIKAKANALMPNMNLKTWKNAKRDGNITKTDVTIAKNYFAEDEIKQLNSLVNMYLDYAKRQIERNKIMKMVDWEKKLDAFLEFNEFPILKDFGKIKKEIADKFAENEYDKYKKIISKEQQQKPDFIDIADNINLSGQVPTENDQIDSKNNEPFSDFNNKLKKALNSNPKNKKEKKPSTQLCPNCGKEIDITEDYCDGDIIDGDGNIVPCGHAFRFQF